MVFTPQVFKTAIRAFALIAVFFLSMQIGHAARQEMSFPCGDARSLMGALMRDGYAYMATAISDRNFITQFYLSTQTGSFVVIGVDNNLQACVILRGGEWLWAIPKQA